MGPALLPPNGAQLCKTGPNIARHQHVPRRSHSGPNIQDLRGTGSARALFFKRNKRTNANTCVHKYTQGHTNTNTYTNTNTQPHTQTHTSQIQPRRNTRTHSPLFFFLLPSLPFHYFFLSFIFHYICKGHITSLQVSLQISQGMNYLALANSISKSRRLCNLD